MSQNERRKKKKEEERRPKLCSGCKPWAWDQWCGKYYTQHEGIKERTFGILPGPQAMDSPVMDKFSFGFICSLLILEQFFCDMFVIDVLLKFYFLSVLVILTLM